MDDVPFLSAARVDMLLKVKRWKNGNVIFITCEKNRPLCCICNLIRSTVLRLFSSDAFFRPTYTYGVLRTRKLVH